MTKLQRIMIAGSCIVVAMLGCIVLLSVPSDTLIYRRIGTDTTGTFKVFRHNQGSILVTRDLRDFFLVSRENNWVKMTTNPYLVIGDRVIYDSNSLEGISVGFAPDGTEDVTVSNGYWSFWIKERNQKISPLTVLVK